jgi:superfamily II DNA or RNA helicase
MTIELRPHQKDAIRMIHHSLATGHKRPLLAAPCSFGKTITAAYLLKTAASHGMKAVFFADRVKLIDQTIDAFESLGLDFGVMQSSHHMTDSSKPIQIASIQTIARRHRKPDIDLAIVDECHVAYESMVELMDRFDNVPFIGLSATPYSKGLGRIYDDLLVPITTQTLLDQGYLCPIDCYGGRSVSTKGIKTKALKTGGSDWDADELAEAIENDKTLAGDIVKNWREHGVGQTIAFSPSIKHSKHLVDMFIDAGIPAAHIDGYMDEAERKRLFQAHDEGTITVLSCSRLLNTGYDAPSVRTLIDCFPTKSLIAYQQRAGRIARTAPGKERAIYLDHAGNVKRHGFAEALVPSVLDDGEKQFAEARQVKEREEKEKRVQDCPLCKRQMQGIRCQCGYMIPLREQLYTDGQMLEKMKKAPSIEDKSQWYSSLLSYSRMKGYSDGYAAHKYREKFGVWPRSLTTDLSQPILPEVISWLKYKAIKYHKAREAQFARSY